MTVYNGKVKTKDFDQQLPKKLMLLIALFQGFGLFVLHQSLDYKFWPFQSPHWLFAFYSFIFIWPICLQLSLTQHNYFSILRLTLPFALLASLLGFYVGWQVTPMEHISFESLLFAFVFTMVLATFKALMYCQLYASKLPITYSGLFLWSWRNFLTLGLSSLFVGCSWLVLFLWAQLFNAIGIEFFKDLFKEEWFAYPVNTLVLGFGVLIFRSQTGIIDTIKRLQQALMKFLLVVLAFVSVLFLMALPFTGLSQLWGNGGSMLILWMHATLLFFVNAVYQDKPSSRPYALWIHRFIYLSVALLPIYSAISFHGLTLRIEQYGLSLMRCWALLVWLLLAVFTLGYVWGIIRHRDNWLDNLSRVNVVGGLVVMVAVLLTNSPLLDFRKMSVDSQLARLEAGEVAVEDFDIHYFKHNLAKPGYLALQQLKTQYQETYANFVLKIDALYTRDKDISTEIDKETFLSALEILGGSPPDDLLNRIFENETENSWLIPHTDNYYLFAVELNNDELAEYVLLKKRRQVNEITLYVFDNDEWVRRSLRATEGYGVNNLELFLEDVKAQNIHYAKPEWDQLEVGGQRFKVGSKFK